MSRKKKLKPKPKKDTKSWQTRNAARLSKQEAFKRVEDNIAIEVEFNRMAAEEVERAATTPQQ